MYLSCLDVNSKIQVIHTHRQEVRFCAKCSYEMQVVRLCSLRKAGPQGSLPLPSAAAAAVQNGPLFPKTVRSRCPSLCLRNHGTSGIFLELLLISASHPPRASWRHQLAFTARVLQVKPESPRKGLSVSVGIFLRLWP